MEKTSPLLSSSLAAGSWESTLVCSPGLVAIDLMFCSSSFSGSSPYDFNQLCHRLLPAQLQHLFLEIVNLPPHQKKTLIFYDSCQNKIRFVSFAKDVWGYEVERPHAKIRGFRKMLVYKLLIYFLSPFTSTLIWTQRPEGQCDLVVMALTLDPAYYDNYTISTAAKEL